MKTRACCAFALTAVLTLPRDDLKNLEVLLTVVGGRVVWEKK